MIRALIRQCGRGRCVAHLLAADGSTARCGARLRGDRWELRWIQSVQRGAVCARCYERWNDDQRASAAVVSDEGAVSDQVARVSGG